MSDIYIDDADPRIQYSTGWKKAGVAEEYSETTHWTEQGGANATLLFTGTGVVVYGTIASKGRTTDEPPITLFSVDDGEQASYYAVPTGKVKYRVLFFSSQTLQNGQHTIVITNHQNSSPFFLDYIVVSSPFPSQSPDVSSTPPLNTTTTVDTMPLSTTSPGMNGHCTNSNYSSLSGSSVTSTASAAIIPTTSSATTYTSSSAPTSVIVGTLLGCLVLILTVIFVMLLWRHVRDKSSRSTSLDLSHLDCGNPAVVPSMMQTDNKMMHRTLRAVHSSTNGAYDGATTSRSTVQWQPMFKSLLGRGPW